MTLDVDLYEADAGEIERIDRGKSNDEVAAIATGERVGGFKGRAADHLGAESAAWPIQRGRMPRFRRRGRRGVPSG